jgi:outer membrane protein assembly factor BamB
MTPTRAAIVATPLVAALLLASCARDEGWGTGTLRVSEIRIPPKTTGPCSFDYRAAVSKVASDGTVVWSTDIPRAEGMPRPVVVDGAIVQATRNGPVALDAASGEPLWQWDGGAAGVWLGAGASGVVQTKWGDIQGLEPRTGAVTWTWSGNGEIQRTEPGGPPGGSSVDTIVVHEAGAVTAIDTTSGDVLWESALAPGSGGDVILDLTADDASVFGLTGPSQVVALRSDTGATTWSWQTTPDALVTEAAQSNDDVVLVHTTPWYGEDGTQEPNPDAAQAVALDAADGRELWRTPYVHDGPHTSLVTQDAVLLWDAGDLRAVDPVSGDLIWEQRGVTGDGVDVQLAAADGVALVVPRAGASAVVALDLATGHQVWRDTFEGRGFSPPTVVDGRVLVGGQTGWDVDDVEAPDVGRLHAIDLATGDVLWSTTFRDSVRIAPVPIADGYVVTSSDGLIGCE